MKFYELKKAKIFYQWNFLRFFQN